MCKFILSTPIILTNENLAFAVSFREGITFCATFVRSTFAKKCTERTILVHRRRCLEGQTVVSLRVDLPLKTPRLEIFIWAKNRWHGIVFRTEGITPFLLGNSGEWRRVWFLQNLWKPALLHCRSVDGFPFLFGNIFSYSRGSESRLQRVQSPGFWIAQLIKVFFLCK